MDANPQQQNYHLPSSKYTALLHNEQSYHSDLPESTVITPSISHSTHNNSNDVFPKFPLLPLELRDQIWSQYITLPGPRLIEVYAERTLCTNPSEYTCETSPCPTIKGSSQCSHRKTGQFFASNPHRFPPLFICHETRRTALKTFSYCFSQPSSPGILFQPKIDTIFFRAENQIMLTNVLLDAQTSQGLKMDNIKSFAFDNWEEQYGRDYGSPSNFFPFLYQGLDPILSGLKHLFIIRIGDSWRGSQEAEDAENWILQIQSALATMKSPLDPSVEVVRKSKLWGGRSETQWVDTPYWQSRAMVEVVRENAKTRAAILGERVRIPLYSHEQQALDDAKVKEEV